MHPKNYEHQKQLKIMPLKKGIKNIGSNIKELELTGRSYNQSLAIALKVANVKKKESR
jgi:hypothetical protein